MPVLNFDANTVDPAAEFEPLPAGKYVVVLANSQMKPTKSGNGKFLELTLQVVEGEHKGRNLWARLCLEHPNETTVKIARAELSALCRAVGVMQPKDSAELHGLPLMVTVRCKKGDDGQIFNEVRGFAKKEAAGGQPQQATGNTPPWARR